MATNNDGHLVDSAGHPVVDFVWGNIPMQPNDERGVSNKLDYTKDTHNIAEDGWNGYPVYTPNTTGARNSGTVDYVVVPNLIGLTTANAIDAIQDTELTLGTSTTTTVGTTPSNVGTVATQSIAAGASSISVGATINIVSYA